MTQPALDELRQELLLNCCEVVLKKRNALLILAIIDQAGHCTQVFEGNLTDSLENSMKELNQLIQEAIGFMHDEIPVFSAFQAK